MSANVRVGRCRPAPSANHYADSSQPKLSRPRLCLTSASRSRTFSSRRGILRSGVNSLGGCRAQSSHAAGTSGTLRSCTDGDSAAHGQAHPSLPPGQRQRPTERHGLGLPRVRQPKSRTRGLARLCTVLPRHLQPQRPDHPYLEPCVGYCCHEPWASPAYAD